MKTLIYITENRNILYKDFEDMGGYEKVVITDPYLIVGIMEDGLLLNPLVNPMFEYDLKPIEKYLMTATNVDFLINSAEFRTPNIPFLFGTIPIPSMGVVGAPFFQYDPQYLQQMEYFTLDLLPVVNARLDRNFLIFNYKKPTDAVFTPFLLQSIDSYHNPWQLYSIDLQINFRAALSDLFVHLPVGTEFYFSDATGEFLETNHQFVI